MAIFEKTEYWGLKDPLEVRVQHGTCIYMGDTKRFAHAGALPPEALMVAGGLIVLDLLVEFPHLLVVAWI